MENDDYLVDYYGFSPALWLYKNNTTSEDADMAQQEPFKLTSTALKMAGVLISSIPFLIKT